MKIKYMALVVGLLLSQIVLAGTQFDGYLSAQFGMSADQVKTVLAKDKIKITSNEEADGDHLIFCERKLDWITTNLLYVFPAKTDRMALVIEVYPGLVDTMPVKKELEKAYGLPSGKDYPESVLKHMQEKEMIPAGVTQLSVWNISTETGDREVRLMMLDKYVRVEYLDNDLMAAR